MSDSLMTVEVTSVWIGALKTKVGTHEATMHAAFAVADWARIYVPIDTGFLHDHIYEEMITEDEWLVVADTEYAEYVERGTIHMAAQPYMRPALAAAKDEYYAELEAAYS